METKKVYMHGELIFFEVDKIPEGAKEIKTKGDFKLADSENTGNHHMLQIHDGVKLFGFNDEFYTKVEEETKAYCVLESRHTDLVLGSKTTWGIVPAQELDHITGIVRKIQD